MYNLDKICKNKTKNQEIRRKKADSFGQMNEKEVIIKKSRKKVAEVMSILTILELDGKEM